MTINNDNTPARVTSVSDLLARYAAGERDFRWANLRGADLRGADLRGADLSGANLYGADLYGADLYEANLYGANLRGADLYEANLRGADLRGADLRGADLSGANLRGANLRWADLYGANLYEANLRGANLYRANLRGADLSGANLYRANLRGAKNPPMSSHDFLAEVLRQAAVDDYEKRSVAGIVAVSRDWGWEEFGAIAQARWTPELRAWIAATLAPWPELVTLARRYGVIERPAHPTTTTATAGEAESGGE